MELQRRWRLRSMELPEELLIEILAQLPVKSLIRFTCVCKYWHSIITSSKFAYKHYATRLKMNQNDNDNDGGFDRIPSQYSEACSITVTSYEDLSYETTFKFRPADEAFEPPKLGVSHQDVIFNLRIHSPCNGIFLLVLSKANEVVWLLWNPAIRDVFKVPGLVSFSFVGFGFDHVTNDYKIVSFVKGVPPLSNKSRLVLLYSLAANSWRQLDNVSFGHGGSCLMISKGFSNGRKCHWIMSESGRTPFVHTYFLVSFDMVDEVFVQTLMPPHHGQPHCYRWFLNQGSNNVNEYPTIYYVEDDAVHIWSLNEYGPTGSWQKLKTLSLTIPESISDSRMIFWKKKYNPVCQPR